MLPKERNYYARMVWGKCTYDYHAASIQGNGSHVRWMVAFADGEDLRKFEVFEFVDRLKELLNGFIDSVELRDSDPNKSEPDNG